MKDNYETCLAFTLKWEGGDVNHPKDPGGATRKGITQATYDKWRASRGQAKQSVFKMTDAELKQIYREWYWNAVKGDELPYGVDLAVFDYGVNSGPARAVKALQALVGAAQDGIVGPETLAKTRSKDAAELVKAICARRLSHYSSLSTWSVFGKGWSRRIADAEATGVRMALAKQAPSKVAERLHEEAVAAYNEADRSRRARQGATVGTVVAGTGAAVVATSETATFADRVVAGAVFVFVAALIIYLIVKRRREKQQLEKVGAYVDQYRKTRE